MGLQRRRAALAGASEVFCLHEQPGADASRLHQIDVGHRQLLAHGHWPDRAHLHVCACTCPHAPVTSPLPTHASQCAHHNSCMRCACIHMHVCPRQPYKSMLDFAKGGHMHLPQGRCGFLTGTLQSIPQPSIQQCLSKNIRNKGDNWLCILLPYVVRNLALAQCNSDHNPCRSGRQISWMVKEKNNGMARAPQLAKTQLGRQEWLSMESAGYSPSALSVLVLFAAPTP